MKLKKLIKDLIEENSIKLKEIEKCNRINNDNINEIRQFHRKINISLIKKKNQHIIIKESVDNENLLEIMMKTLENLLTNNNRLNEIKRWIVFQKEQNKKNVSIQKKNIHKIIKDIELTEKHIEIEKIDINSTTANSNHKNYILNPFHEIMEKYNEVCLQREIIKKFKSFQALKKNSNNYLNKEIEKSKCGLINMKKELSNNDNINEVNLENINVEIKDNVIKSDSSIGSIDSKIINSVDSPKFLIKIKPKKTMDFHYEQKLNFDIIKQNKKKINKSDNLIELPQKPLIKKLNSFTILNNKTNTKKVTEKKIDVQQMNIKEINTEIESSQIVISQLTKKLEETLNQNNVLKNQKKSMKEKLSEQEYKIKIIQKEINKLKNLNNLTNPISLAKTKKHPNPIHFFDDKFSPYEDSNIFTSSNENRNTIKK